METAGARRSPTSWLKRGSNVIPQSLSKTCPAFTLFIAKDDTAAAERVLDAVDKTFEQLAQHPDCGARYPTRNPKLKAVRMFPVIGFRDYLIFYRTEADSIRVLYVTHGARHLLRLFRRESRE